METRSQRKMSAFIASGTDIQLEMDGVKHRFRSRLVGMDPDHYLVLKAPTALTRSRIASSLIPGTRLTVRYVFKGSVWGFRCQILRALPGFRAVFVSFPDSVENHDLRTACRIDTRIAAELRSEDTRISGFIVDLSLTGARFAFRQNGDQDKGPQLETPVDLILPLTACGEPTDFSAMVRSVQLDQNRMIVGLEFQDLDTEVSQRLQEFLRGATEITFQ